MSKLLDTFLAPGARWFDAFNRFWHREATHKTISFLLLVIFLAALAAIEANRRGWLPQPLALQVPKSHYMAINLAFLLVLVMEIFSMIFALPGSMSRALGKQFEILALIFLRNTFKELSVLPEPISLSHHNEVLWHILSYGFGSLAIFALLGLFVSKQERLDRALQPGPSLDRFIAAKKNVALLMVIVFCLMGIYDNVLRLYGLEGFYFFQSFYTVLIFSDIFMVLIAQAYLPQFPAVFRNSGFALATLLIRMSLTAPAYFNVLIGLASVILAIIVTLVYNKFYTMTSEEM